MPEPERDAAEVFGATVDGLGGSVAGAGMVEEREDVIAALVESPAKLS